MNENKPVFRIERVREETLADWQVVHNEIIPGPPLSIDAVRTNSERYELFIAYVGNELVGCSTVRPPAEEERATVIVRVLEQHRGQGVGTAMLKHALDETAQFNVREVETVVTEIPDGGANVEGIRFGEANGFTEKVDRYELDDGEITYVHLLRR